MTKSPDGKEVAHYSFETQKDGKSFTYEMKLLFFEVTEEYCFLRRWYFSDAKKKPVWKHGGWNTREDRKFDMKVVQKRDIMNYQLKKSKETRKTTKQNKPSK